MGNKIEEIKAVLNGGSRATKYRVKLAFPTVVDRKFELKELSCLAKSASFPEVSIGQIEVFNQGRCLPIPGDTSYSKLWPLTFYVDNSHQVRKDFLSWQKAIDNFRANTHSGYVNDLFVEISVSQLDSLEKEVAEYTLANAWPQAIGEISIAADALDTIQEFEVTFSFSDWYINNGSEWHMPQDGRSSSKNVVAPDQ